MERSWKGVELKILPGQNIDGSGLYKVCIHYVVPDKTGPFTEPHVLHIVGKQQVVAKPARCRLACDRKRKVAPVMNKKTKIVTVTMRSDDPRAVTCPRCKASVDYTEAMTRLGGQDASSTSSAS